MSELLLFPALCAPHDPKPALVVEDSALSYVELAQLCGAVRDTLDKLAVPPGERVFVWAERDLASLAGLVAVLLSGRVLVPINPEVGERELAHMLLNASPRAVFATDVERTRARLPDLPAIDLSALVARARHLGRGQCHEVRPLPGSACCLVLYTSGTTGAPKGAMLSPRNITCTLDGLSDAWALREADTLVHALPVFHAHGLVFGMFGALRLGATLQHVPKFSPESVMDALTTPGRVLYAVPTMYHRLLEAMEVDVPLREVLRHAKLLVSGSAALPARIHARIEALTGQRVAERYGLSETLINSAARADGPRRPGTVGTALPGVEIRLVDDARQALTGADPEAIGEIAVRGANVFSGYLGNPVATRQVVDDAGFFYTGDLGKLEADGTLRIVGRKGSDLIKTGGFKVGAGEVENALLEHADVREVAVAARADADLGERIVAFVVARDPAAPPAKDDLVDLVARLIGKHKRPREVRFVDSLPRNAMGKVQKALLPG